MESLPQCEKTFDVTAVVSNGLTQATRYARNIVLVTTGVDSLRLPRVTYGVDTYARPQLVLHLRASTASQLRKYILYNVRAMERELVLHELNSGIATLRDRHNLQAETLVSQQFGVRLWVPEDLTKWKRGKNFLWLSNDAVKGMQNICVYRCPATQPTAASMLAVRDSVMRCNMPGEEVGDYMTTVGQSVKVGKSAQGRIRTSGLWEMRTDAMGGPFVSLSTIQGDSMLVVEAFVYAPGMKKRNLIRRLEASLHTMKTENYQLNTE